jgi:RNA polymerase sigma-70 factor, ECF subfamily
MPAPPDELQLHHRLLAGDETASADLCNLYHNWLADALIAKYRAIDERDDALPIEAASNALLDYIQRPSQYDPTRMSLRGYLLMAARRDLLTLWRRDYGRDPLHQSFEELVELGEEPRNRNMDEPEELTVLRETAERCWERVQDALPDKRDLQVFTLICLGERETSVFAAALGISNQPVERQRVGVKRAKDRIMTRVRRAMPTDMNL